jgi:radical SAM enzyme (TIGR01210 family)
MTLSIQGYPFDYTTNSKFSPIYKRQIKQRTLIIPGGGCVYYRANKGDVCPFCAFPPFSRYVIKGDNHDDYFESWALTAEIYQQMYLAAQQDTQPFDKLAVFNGGSFFPSSELPSQFQHFVYEDVAKRSNIKQLMVEAYPSFISEKKLQQAQEMLAATDLMVGIGFESLDETVRNQYLKKRIDLALFENKVKMMQKLGVQVFVYAFLKAPQLTERQALNETLATLDYLHQLGVDEIALSCAFVPPGTQLEALFHAGDFRPPWLWSIIEIIETAQKKGWPLSVGGFDDTPPPIATPNNCTKCDAIVLQAIDEHRLNNTIKRLSVIDCECKRTWFRQLNTSKVQFENQTDINYQLILTS